MLPEDEYKDFSLDRRRSIYSYIVHQGSLKYPLCRRLHQKIDMTTVFQGANTFESSLCDYPRRGKSMTVMFSVSSLYYPDITDVDLIDLRNKIIHASIQGMVSCSIRSEPICDYACLGFTHQIRIGDDGDYVEMKRGLRDFIYLIIIAMMNDPSSLAWVDEKDKDGREVYRGLTWMKEFFTQHTITLSDST